jgi:hypothetical protein
MHRPWPPLLVRSRRWLVRSRPDSKVRDPPPFLICLWWHCLPGSSPLLWLVVAGLVHGLGGRLSRGGRGTSVSSVRSPSRHRRDGVCPWRQSTWLLRFPMPCCCSYKRSIQSVPSPQTDWISPRLLNSDHAAFRPICPNQLTDFFLMQQKRFAHVSLKRIG